MPTNDDDQDDDKGPTLVQRLLTIAHVTATNPDKRGTLQMAECLAILAVMVPGATKSDIQHSDEIVASARRQAKADWPVRNAAGTATTSATIWARWNSRKV